MDARQIQQITDRISLNLQSKGVSPDTQSIFDKLAAYINDFGVVPSEAERKVLSDQYKKYDIPEETKPVSQPSASSGNEVVNLADIQESDWVTVEVKVVSLQPPNSPAISQTGILADSTGAVRFVTFSKASELPELELEKWYRIESAVVDSFRGALNLKMHSGSRISEIEDDRCLVPASPTPVAEIRPGVVPCIHVKYVDEWESRSERMMQTGLVADESGRIKFVMWNDPNKEKLKVGSVYTIFYASVDEFNGRYSLTLNSAMWLEDDEAAMPNIQIRSSAPTEPLPVSRVRDLQTGYASVRVKFVEEWESRSERMLQTGLVGDESGRMKFVIWKDDKKQPLELGRIYQITNAKVDEFNGRLSLSLNPAEYSVLEEAADFEVGTQLDEISGSLVQISKGSGLIKRCPVEGCGRALSKQNLCPVHEIQNNYTYDMRIKAVVDDGHKAHNVLIGRELTEEISGMTMDEAIDIGTSSPLGLDEVLVQLTERLCGRYVRCKGSMFDNRMMVRSVEFMKYDASEVAALMNRAGENAGGSL